MPELAFLANSHLSGMPLALCLFLELVNLLPTIAIRIPHRHHPALPPLLRSHGGGHLTDIETRFHAQQRGAVHCSPDHQPR